MFPGLLADDFPERMDPMTVKEFRQGLRARKFVVPFVAVQVVMVLVAALEWMSATRGAFFDFPDEVMGRYAVLFWGVLGIVLLLVVPITRFFDLQQEFSGRNAELLLLSGVDRWHIVRGKWMVSMMLSVLIFVSVLPYLILRYFFGGFEWGPNLLIGFALLLNAAVLSALVIGVSAYRNYFGRILLLTSAAVVVFLVVTLPSIGSISAFEQAGGRWFFVPLFVLNFLATGFLLCILGLQLARVKLRTFEDPYDPAPSSQVVVLYLFVPVLIGIPALMSFGVLSIVSSLFFAWVAYNIDPPPKKSQRALYAQH